MKTITRDGIEFGELIMDLEWAGTKADDPDERMKISGIVEKIESQLPANYDDADDPEAYWNSEKPFTVELTDQEIETVESLQSDEEV